jgi:hypothetical protein
VRTLHIKIEDKYLETVLILLNSLKDGMIKNLTVENDFIVDKERCINDLKKIKSGDTNNFYQKTPDELFKELDI